MNLDLAKLNRIQQVNLSTYQIHSQTFPQFKCINQGKKVYIIASGPSAARVIYNKKITNDPDGVYIGVNRSFQIGNGCFDMNYIFIQDYSGKTKEYIDELDEYRKDECQKFYGLTAEWRCPSKFVDKVIPESHAIKANALRYRTDWVDVEGFTNEFAYNLSAQPLGCFGSIVFPALQFALWTYPKEIYLIGCDCSEEGYAYKKNEKNFLPVTQIINAYKKFKIFAYRYYPDVKIYSINPVGLKGLFQDIIL